ncbi:hypothetical protein S40288_01007 [Stachybotrys chartarum IBT 40288]|nr:hypothetical protein S40288_01007 [Stachybotrys chartarum IBT 40288]
MATYFVTGASRGLGLGFCTALAANGSKGVSKVFAAARTETDALKQLISKSAGLVELVLVDVTCEESVKKAAAQVEQSLSGRGLDVLINNAGIMPHTPGGIAAMTDIESVFKVNVVGVQLITSSLLPLLKKGNLKKILNTSSGSGSIGLAPTFERFGQRSPAYQISKAALNRLTAQYAAEYANEGFVVLAVSPGWVNTDMGGESADNTIETSINAVLRILYTKRREDTGKFFNIHVPG